MLPFRNNSPSVPKIDERFETLRAGRLLLLIFLVPIALVLTYLFPDASSSRALAVPNVREINLIAQLGGTTQAIATTDTHAYIGIGPTILVLDISDPWNPSLVGQTEILSASPVNAIDIDDNYLYVISGSTETYFGIFSLSDPTVPLQISSLHLEGRGEGLEVMGNFAYIVGGEPVSGGNGWLKIISIANRSLPNEVGLLELISNTPKLSVAPGYAYVAEGARLHTISVGDPANPAIVDSIQQGDHSATDITVVGDRAYLTYGYGDGHLRIFSVADPDNIVELGSLQLGIEANAVTISDDTAYVSTWGTQSSCARLNAVSIASPTNPSMIDSIDFSGNCLISHDLAISGDFVYASVWNFGMQSFWTGGTSALSPAGDYLTIQDARALAVDGELAVLADSDQGLWTVSVSDATKLSTLGFNRLFWGARDVAISGSYAYITGGFDGFFVLSLANPSSPQVVGQVDPFDSTNDVLLRDGYAYLTDDERLRIIDISDPEQPRETGFYEAPHAIGEIAIANDYIYAIGWNSLRVISVADPSQPIEVSYLEQQLHVSDATIANGYLYIANGDLGLSIFSLENPTQPTLVAEYPTSSDATGVAIHAGDAYVLKRDGISVISVTAPSAPFEVTNYDLPVGFIVRGNIVIAGEYIYVAAGSAGLLVLEMQEGPDGRIELASGRHHNVPQDDTVLVTFARDMITSTVAFESNPDPGGWHRAWNGTNDVLTLTHSAFQTATIYSFSVTAGQTLDGVDIVPFGTSFATEGTSTFYLPLLRNAPILGYYNK